MISVWAIVWDRNRAIGIGEGVRLERFYCTIFTYYIILIILSRNNGGTFYYLDVLFHK